MLYHNTGLLPTTSYAYRHYYSNHIMSSIFHRIFPVPWEIFHHLVLKMVSYKILLPPDLFRLKNDFQKFTFLVVVVVLRFHYLSVSERHNLFIYTYNTDHDKAFIRAIDL